MKTLKILAVVLLLVSAAGLTACQTGPGTEQVLQPRISLDTRDDNILAGDSTTIFAESANLLGRDVQVDWSTTIGEIEPMQNGRMARFSSDIPGVAIVTAEANTDGRVLRDQINIRVDAVE
ncbi:MAG: hypothetical protein ACOCTI_07350 [Phycisphaeraceae bacterium]